MKERRPESHPRHEPTDASPRVAALLAGSMAILIALGLAAGWPLSGRRSGGERNTPEAARALFQNGPSSQTSVERSWQEYEHDSRLHLEHYAWIDRKDGVVRIPLERAVELMVGNAQPLNTVDKEARPSP